MKKSKILIPVLSIAGLGAAIAPIAMMTSCSCNSKDQSVLPIILEKKDEILQSDEIKGNLDGEKQYTCICEIPADYSTDTFEIVMEGTTLAMNFSSVELYKNKEGTYEKQTDIDRQTDRPAFTYKNFQPEEQYKITFKLSTDIVYDGKNSIIIRMPKNK